MRPIGGDGYVRKKSKPEGEVRTDSVQFEPPAKKRGCLSGCLSRVGAVILIALIVVIAIAAFSSTGSDDESSLNPTIGTEDNQTTEAPESDDSTNASATEFQADISNTMHELDGEVLIMTDANFMVSGNSCQDIGDFANIAPGATITIRPKGHDAVTAVLGDGSLSAEGNCRMGFTPMIPEADEYVFIIGDHTETKRREIMEWPEPQGWWASVQYD